MVYPFAGTVLAADPVIVHVSKLKGLRSLSNVHTRLGHRPILDAEAVRRKISDNITNAIPVSTFA
jgi:hypothetical protein